MKIGIANVSAKDVAERWEKQYLNNGNWMTGRDKIHAQIIAAGNDAEKIAEAIGNKSWTHISCAECGESELIGVEFGRYSDETFHVCLNCITAASVAIKAVKESLR